MAEGEIKKLYSEVVTFLNTGRFFRIKYDAKKRPIPGTTAPRETKLDYAIDKMVLKLTSAIKPLTTKFADKCEDIRAEHAATEEKGGKQVIAREHVPYGNDKERMDEKYMFTPEKDKLVRELLRKEMEALDLKQVSFTPHIAKIEDIPLDLTLEQIEAFRGFVIPEDYDPEVAEEEAKKRAAEVKG